MIVWNLLKLNDVIHYYIYLLQYKKYFFVEQYEMDEKKKAR